VTVGIETYIGSLESGLAVDHLDRESVAGPGPDLALDRGVAEGAEGVVGSGGQLDPDVLSARVISEARQEVEELGTVREDSGWVVGLANDLGGTGVSIHDQVVDSSRDS
jgi:hypothetical protein